MNKVWLPRKVGAHGKFREALKITKDMPLLSERTSNKARWEELR